MQTFCVLFKPLAQEQPDVDHADNEVLRTRAIKLFYLLPQMLFFAPMRTFGSEIRFEQMQNAKKEFCLTATTFAAPIQRAVKIDKSGVISMLFSGNFNKRSQDLEEVFHDAGQFYWGTLA